MKKSEVIKQLVQTEAFTNNAAAKEILANAIKFMKEGK